MMARKFLLPKPLIYVFCEGESEQAYTAYLKEIFRDVAVIKIPSELGLFSTAKAKFAKDAKFRDIVSEVDEIWFFFDVEKSDQPNWDNHLKIIRHLRNLRKKPGVRVRLLMTTACIEYWLLLHYKRIAPPLSTISDKESMLRQVRNEVPEYQKGNRASTWKIAVHYKTAVENAQSILHRLQQDGLPTLEDTDERNRWLFCSSFTFTTVQEAIQFLETEREKRT